MRDALPLPQAVKACNPRTLGMGADSGHHEAEHERGNRREGIDGRPSADQLPGLCAAGAEHVKPRPPRDQCGPDRGRPQDIAAGDKLLIPTLDDGLRLGTRGGIGNLPLGHCSLLKAGVSNAYTSTMDCSVTSGSAMVSGRDPQRPVSEKHLSPPSRSSMAVDPQAVATRRIGFNPARAAKSWDDTASSVSLHHAHARRLHRGRHSVDDRDARPSAPS